MTNIDTKSPSKPIGVTISQVPQSAMKPLPTAPKELLPLAEVMKTLMSDTNGTVLELPKFTISFPKDKHSASAVTEMEVEIMSEETSDTRLLHRIYTNTLEKTQVELRESTPKTHQKID